ncbi:hypothetical protein B0H67DRAFT_590970 [Lasiosphaeris hirsuta]|uniref:Uncharacterized protein n=1 Tax=Lasiosphaeris hirsuta TaxID=260670 RepID=A0AA40DQV7_9PEZI|nr:hypothetical protein B0H67DRAFT_590970 [Lasiosphaeris hirsuta]
MQITSPMEHPKTHLSKHIAEAEGLSDKGLRLTPGTRITAPGGGIRRISGGLAVQIQSHPLFILDNPIGEE